MAAKVLIVDNDPDILDAVTIILQSEGYKVVTARNGAEGLARLKAEEPDLMILDLLMPNMDGFAVSRQLRTPQWAKYRDTPVLLLTSVREEASRRRYERQTGIHLDKEGYLEKPVAPEDLLDRVRRLLSKKQESLMLF